MTKEELLNSLNDHQRAYVDLDLGDKAKSITITDNGILASGKPNLSHALIHASTRGPILGLASPISSYAITVMRLYIISKSSASISRAK